MNSGSALLLVGMLCASTACAQEAKDYLRRISKCGNSKVKAAVDTLGNGILRYRWVKSEGQKQAALPAEYLNNLAALAQSCEDGSATYSAIVEDLNAKITDCRRHGMGRLVPVEVETLHGTQPVGLWQVFYEWFTGKSSGATEVRVPGVTPTKLALPPGIYSFHARKDQLATTKVKVPVAGRDLILVQIAVQ